MSSNYLNSECWGEMEAKVARIKLKTFAELAQKKKAVKKVVRKPKPKQDGR